MSGDIITLKLPAKPEYVMVARLTSAAIASRFDFDVDQIEDVKMSVAEALILIIKQAASPKELSVQFRFEHENMHIDIIGEGDWEQNPISPHDTDQTQLSRYILGSMMDGVEFKTDNGLMRAICMHKGCGGAN